ncbi:centrosome-associated protein 350-like isoform X2 [Heptranchias perlo]|uniref:centrosome-associated protein 350-like isoform X2 n=1 Tax=Heptranchias perlo TaxID=212740 RepID=UPI00355AB5AE
MENSGGDNSPSLSESAGSNTWMRSWDNSSTLSALNIGSGSEIDGRDEDKEIASKAVAFVIRSSRKGVVPLCADVASLLKIKWRLERTIKAQQLEIHRLLSMSRTHCNQSAASTQTNSSGRSSPSSCVQSVIQTTEPLSCKEKQQFVIHESPRIPHQLDEEVLAKPVTASQSVESSQEPVQRDKSTMSREVPEECPKLLMQKRCEEQLMETLLLNSKLTDDLGDAWQQIELLRDRLRQSEKQQPQEILSMGYMYHERDDSRPCDTGPTSTACRCVSQAFGQDTGLASYIEEQCLREKTNTTDQGRLRKLSINCKLPTKKGQLQSTTHDDAPKARRQKLPININDYVIVNGNKSGTARYVGHLDNSGMANAVFVGVELDEPSGQHDGTFEGKKYFQCYENFAIFVPVHEIFYVINKKPKKSISPPALSSMQHRHSLGPHSSSTNNSGARGEHSHQANSRKKKQHAPKDPNPTKRSLRKSGAFHSSRTSDPSVIPSQEGWSDSNGRTEKESGSSLQPKINNRASTITASLPPDLTQYRPVHASIRASPRKVLRR